MKKPLLFKSIYAKFAVIFLLIWWFLNTLTFIIVTHIISYNRTFEKFAIEHLEFFYELEKMRRVVKGTYFFSAILGTIIILLVVRGIVMPLKKLSTASKEVAKGNFDIEVDIKASDEIGQLTTDFNLMTKELKSMDVLQKDFVSNVSHEFKTPITSIQGYARLIRSGKLDDEQIYEYSSIIENESQRLSVLSSNLLKLSELDSKVIREPFTSFSLDEQIRKSILLLEHFWVEKNIDLDINLEQITYWGDENLLQQVWINLIHNAIKFSYQNGTVRIILTKKDENIQLKVIDYGVGIEEPNKELIFKRFYKSDKSRTGEGNGLGLVIVKKIVELHNGKINYTSSLGHGSQFIVELKI